MQSRKQKFPSWNMNAGEVWKAPAQNVAGKREGEKGMQFHLTDTMWTALQAAELTERETGRIMSAAFAATLGEGGMDTASGQPLALLLAEANRLMALAEAPAGCVPGWDCVAEAAEDSPQHLMMTRAMWQAMEAANLTDRDAGILMRAVLGQALDGQALPETLGKTVRPLAMLFSELNPLAAAAHRREKCRRCHVFEPLPSLDAEEVPEPESQLGPHLFFTASMWQAVKSAELQDGELGRTMRAMFRSVFAGESAPVPSQGLVPSLALLLSEAGRQAQMATCGRTPSEAAFAPAIWEAVQCAGLTDRELGQLMGAVFRGIFAGEAPDSGLGRSVLPLALLVLELQGAALLHPSRPAGPDDSEASRMVA